MAVLASAIWRARPSGSNTNGGGYDGVSYPGGIDYSQQNAAQATGTLGTASGTTAFTDAGGAFTSAMVGNALWIASGAGFTVGAYFITAFTSSTAVTLDRSPGTGTVAHWALGGGWADFWTNTVTTIKSLNTVFILGSGTPNPAAYTYDYDQTAQLNASSLAAGTYYFANDPATPGYKVPPDTTGGMPVIKFDVASSGILVGGADACFIVSGLWIVGTTTAAGQYYMQPSWHPTTAFGCVMDQFSFDLGLISANNSIGPVVVGCEVFTSVAPGGPGSAGCITGQGPGGAGVIFVDGCNFHDAVGYGTLAGSGGLIIRNSIIAKNRQDGIKFTAAGQDLNVSACTIDGNLGHGINCQTGFANLVAYNNIISNHTQAGKFGIIINGSPGFADYNTYYNNTANYSGLVAGPHDTALGVTPYVASATENYTLA